MTGCGVYIIRTGKTAYIGSSRNIDNRLRMHVRDLFKGKHPNAKLQLEFNHHDGLAQYEVLIECTPVLLELYEYVFIEAAQNFYELANLRGKDF